MVEHKDPQAWCAWCSFPTSINTHVYVRQLCVIACLRTVSRCVLELAQPPVQQSNQCLTGSYGVDPLAVVKQPTLLDSDGDLCGCWLASSGLFFLLLSVRCAIIRAIFIAPFWTNSQSVSAGCEPAFVVSIEYALGLCDHPGSCFCLCLVMLEMLPGRCRGKSCSRVCCGRCM